MYSRNKNIFSCIENKMLLDWWENKMIIFNILGCLVVQMRASCNNDKCLIWSTEYCDVLDSV